MKIATFVLPAFLVLSLAACGDDHDHDHHGEGHDHKHEHAEKAAQSESTAQAHAHDEHKHDEKHMEEKASHSDSDGKHADHDHEKHEHGDEKGEHDGHEHHEHDHDHDGERKDHAAHEHGVARLTVATTDNGVEIMLETPAANLFGFEHTAKTDEEKQVVSTAKAKLEGVFAPNGDAACDLASHAVDMGHEHEGHSDVGASWNFTCKNPDKLNSVGVQLFSAFPNGFQHINAEWVTATGAGAQEIEQDTTLQLR